MKNYLFVFLTATFISFSCGESKTEICPKCGGKGEAIYGDNNSNGISTTHTETCGLCNGEKKVTKEEYDVYQKNQRLMEQYSK